MNICMGIVCVGLWLCVCMCAGTCAVCVLSVFVCMSIRKSTNVCVFFNDVPVDLQPSFSSAGVACCQGSVGERRGRGRGVGEGEG